MIGTTVGPYHVVSALGAGGMGEVYRARDTRLQREVALKVLPASVAQDPDRLARFEREAQVLASLNHPNIAQIYGLERAGDTTALVLELVEGPTLADRLTSGALPRSDAIAIARQIVDALEAAHENGIVHRDLKPANIKVRADDTVKVLDFGLAKAFRPDAASGDATPTMTSPAMTQRGVILGTAAYMSPEQARGRVVDRRADIWAFGVVLYEMLTGERPFGGDDVTEILASVIKDEVNWRRLPSDLPPSLVRLLRRCLERDPKRRLSAIADARLELEDPGPTDAAPIDGLPSSRRRPGWLAWTIVVSTAALAVAVAIAAWMNLRQEPTPVPIRFSIDTPDASMDAQSSPAISPDGRLIAFIAFKPQTTTNVVWIRPLDAVDAKPLAGTESATMLFWSADSRFVAFMAHGSLMKADSGGGSVSVVGQLPAKVAVPYGGTWGHSVILLALLDGRLLRVPDDGGELTDMFPAGKDGKHRTYNPLFLPDGRHFVYVQLPDNPTATDRGSTFVASVDGGRPTEIIASSDDVVAVIPDFLILTRDGHSFTAQRFDADRLRVTGDPIRIENLVERDYDISLSDTGVLAYRRANASSLADLVWTDRGGKVTGVAAEGRRFYEFRIAPDERRVAVAKIEPGGNQVSVLDLTTHVATPLSVTFKNADDPVWSGDGASVGFVSTTAPGVNNFFQEHPGDAQATPLLESDQLKYLDDWSRDGRYVLFHTGEPASTLFELPLSGDRKPTPLIQTAEVDEAHFSPDGKWVAYQTIDSGLSEIWVAAFPAFDHRQRLSADGGCEPWWRGDGKELFYLSLDGHLMSVPVTSTPGGTIEFHAATTLFQSPLRSPARVIDEYGVTQDGNRFLFVQPRETTVQPIMVVVNWLRGIGR